MSLRVHAFVCSFDQRVNDGGVWCTGCSIWKSSRPSLTFLGLPTIALFRGKFKMGQAKMRLHSCVEGSFMKQHTTQQHNLNRWTCAFLICTHLIWHRGGIRLVLDEYSLKYTQAYKYSIQVEQVMWGTLLSALHSAAAATSFKVMSFKMAHLIVRNITLTHCYKETMRGEGRRPWLDIMWM